MQKSNSLNSVYSLKIDISRPTSIHMPEDEHDEKAPVKLDGKDTTISQRTLGDIQDLDLFDDEQVEHLSSLKVAELKERCKATGLKVSGNKEVLIARLSEEEDPEVDLDDDKSEDSDILKKFKDLLSEEGFVLDKVKSNYKVKKGEASQDDGEDLSSLKVTQLKKLLKEAELPVSGSISELINRLKENSEVNLDDNSNEEVLETQNEGE